MICKDKDSKCTKNKKGEITVKSVMMMLCVQQ